MSGELLKLVADLPEVYQPIFGHPELSSGVSRGCQDRLDYIAPIHNALRAAFGRDLRVLDLGCAQGFFSLSLAGLGAHVHGVDLLDKNIAVCEHLAREQSGLALRFETARLETVVERLAPGQYDLVLGLSVFHHLIHEQGVAPVQAILSRLAECANALVVEFALRDEPLYWGPSQPRLPRELLCGSSFVHQLALCPTHLSEIQRPLFYASNRWLVFAETAYPFISCATDPHQLAHNTHEASRLYFVGDEFVAKQYLLDHPTRGWHNKNEAEREREFLASPLDGFAAPQLIGAAQSESEALVVMERLHGRLLLDLLMEGAVLNRMSILRQILEQLVVLERAGIYHNDIRTWNVLVDDHGSARLIDFGALCSAPVDCVWPRNVFLAFFIFVRELATGQVDNPDPLRTIAISPNSLPEPYRGWALRVWQDPPTKWSFFRMLTYLDASSDPLGDVTANDVWNSAMEAALQEQKRFAQALRDRLDAFQTTHVIESQKFNDELSEVGSNLKELDAVRRECADRADLLQQQAHQMALRAVEAETLAAARAREVDQSAAHMRELVEIAKYQAELFNQQFAVRFTQFESTLAARQADSLATHAHLEWAQARVTEVETQNQRLYEQALRRADEAHAALRAAEARAASEERRAMSFEAELLLARAEKLEAGSACERAEQRCKELEIDLSASDSTAQQLRLEVARLQDSAMSLEAELLLARAEKLEAGSACERAEQRCKELEIDLNSADSTAQQLKQEVARQQDSVDALSRSLEEARAERIDLLAAAHDMEGRCRQLADESVVLRDALAQGKDQISYWHERVLQLHASTSWRVTKPLRFIKRLLSRNRPNIGEIGVAPQNSKPPYRWSQAALAHSIRYVFVRPRVQRALSRAIKKFPGLHSRLREFGISSGAVPSPYVAATNMNAIRSTSTSEGRATATPRLVQVEHMIQQDAAEPDLTESVLDDSAVARVRERLWGAGQ